MSKVVIPLFASTSTLHNAWTCLAKLYASKSHSCMTHVKEQLHLMNKGTKLVFYYLHSLKGIFDEPVLIYYSLSNDDLIIHALNCLELDFKEIVVVVHGRDNPISFEELHDKLVEHETFLQEDES